MKWSVRVIVCVLEELRGGSSREKGIKKRCVCECVRERKRERERECV